MVWMAGAKWSGQVISWASFLVITRLLLPSDFGLMGMALLYCGLLQVVTDAFGTAVTTLRDLTDEQLAQLNTLALTSGFVACLLSCVLAVPLGHFFRSTRLPSIILVMSTMCIVSGLRTVPYGLLYRDMRMRLLSVFDAAQSIAQALVMLVLAWLGFGVWTLVLGNIVGIVLLTALQLSWRPWRFAWPKLSAVKSALVFCRHIMVANLSWYGYSNADFLLAGRLLGQTALGIYTLAWTLAMIPLEKVAVIVSNVSFPYFSAAQNDRAALRRYLQILTGGLSIFIFPATIGLALMASDFVYLVLGEHWYGAIVPLKVLASLAALRSLIPMLSSILNVTGESRFAMRTMQAGLILMPAAFYIGSHWGPSGIAYGWLAAYPVIALSICARAFRKIEMSWATYLGTLGPALTSSLVMAVAVEIVKLAIAPTSPVSVRLGLEVLAGGLAYILTLGLLYRGRWSELSNFIRPLRNSAGVSSA